VKFPAPSGIARAQVGGQGRRAGPPRALRLPGAASGPGPACRRRCNCHRRRRGRVATWCSARPATPLCCTQALVVVTIATAAGVGAWPPGVAPGHTLCCMQVLVAAQTRLKRNTFRMSGHGAYSRAFIGCFLAWTHVHVYFSQAMHACSRLKTLGSFSLLNFGWLLGSSLQLYSKSLLYLSLSISITKPSLSPPSPSSLSIPLSPSLPRRSSLSAHLHYRSLLSLLRFPSFLSFLILWFKRHIVDHGFNVPLHLTRCHFLATTTIGCPPQRWL
jgi:hypothetical protein